MLSEKKAGQWWINKWIGGGKKCNNQENWAVGISLFFKWGESEKWREAWKVSLAITVHTLKHQGARCKDNYPEENNYFESLQLFMLRAAPDQNPFHLDCATVRTETQCTPWKPRHGARKKTLCKATVTHENRCNHWLRVWLLALIADTSSLFFYGFKNTDSLNYLKAHLWKVCH